VYVADREGDIRALMDLAARRGHPADWLVRATHNRNTALGEKLWDRLARTEPLGEVEFMLPAAPGRAARRVRQTLYSERVTLPAHRGAPALAVTAILAREEHPPAGETALEWRLLTNRMAETLEPVVELIDWYRRRWRIGVSGQGHITQSVQVRPRLTDSGLVAWEAPWRESKTVKPSDLVHLGCTATH
jgi:hypothetical protein